MHYTSIPTLAIYTEKVCVCQLAIKDIFIYIFLLICEIKGPIISGSPEGGCVLKSSYVNKDLEETRRLLTQVRRGGKRSKKARKKLEAKGIRYYTSEEAESLGIE